MWILDSPILFTSALCRCKFSTTLLLDVCNKFCNCVFCLYTIYIIRTLADELITSICFSTCLMLTPGWKNFSSRIRVFYIECNFYTNRQAVHVITKRKELATKLLMFLKLLLRYMYLRADECIRYEKECYKSST